MSASAPKPDVLEEDAKANVRREPREGVESLCFRVPQLDELPIDPEERNFVRKPVRNSIYSRVLPTPLKEPRLLGVSLAALELVGIGKEMAESRGFLDVFSGNAVHASSVPLSHCYCGYQFGHFAGQLGDGAVVMLGELEGADGRVFEVQLKGSGLTPYSRSADGRKVLRSSVREFLCSEHMHALGIPTTRASSVVVSDSTVVRDQFYSGEPREERCAVVTRIAETFLRFGSFEIFKGVDAVTGEAGPSAGNEELRKRLFLYASRRYFGEQDAGSDEVSGKVRAVYGEVARRTANLVAGWIMVGHTNGVSNTDNCSLIGLSLDYGPFGFMDRFSRDYVSNSSDDGARYSYSNQPKIMRWNLERLADMWDPLLEDGGVSLRESLGEVYDEYLKRKMLQGMRGKLGLFGGCGVKGVAEGEGGIPTEFDGMEAGSEDDESLYEDLLTIMERSGADFSNTFTVLRSMALPKRDDVEANEMERERIFEELRPQLSSYEDMLDSMRPTVSAMGLAAIVAVVEEGKLPDHALFHRLAPFAREQLSAAGRLPSKPERGMLCMLLLSREDVMQRVQQEAESVDAFLRFKDDVSPSKKSETDHQIWCTWLQRYQDRLLLDLEADPAKFPIAHDQLMRAANPRFVLRNHIAQMAIACAERGDQIELSQTLQRLQDPFDADPTKPQTVTPAALEAQVTGDVAVVGIHRTPATDGLQLPIPPEHDTQPLPPGSSKFAFRYDSRPPDWACKLRVSCSS